MKGETSCAKTLSAHGKRKNATQHHNIKALNNIIYFGYKYFEKTSGLLLSGEIKKCWGFCSASIVKIIILYFKRYLEINWKNIHFWASSCTDSVRTPLRSFLKMRDLAVCCWLFTFAFAYATPPMMKRKLALTVGQPV